MIFWNDAVEERLFEISVFCFITDKVHMRTGQEILLLRRHMFATENAQRQSWFMTMLFLFTLRADCVWLPATIATFVFIRPLIHKYVVLF